MTCEYCDSLLKEIPEGGTCPNCGAPLATTKATQETQKVYPDPPVGVYENHIGHHIEINDEALVIRRRPSLFEKLTEVETVKYTDLYSVSITRPGLLTAGFLSVRSKEKKYHPLPTKISKAVDDGLSITIGGEFPKFYKVYEFLKQCVDINTAE